MDDRGQERTIEEDMLNYTSIKTGGHARLLTSPRYVTLSLLVSVGDGGREGVLAVHPAAVLESSMLPTPDT